MGKKLDGLSRPCQACPYSTSRDGHPQGVITNFQMKTKYTFLNYIRSQNQQLSSRCGVERMGSASVPKPPKTRKGGIETKAKPAGEDAG
jgi:hypothetical protein